MPAMIFFFKRGAVAWKKVKKPEGQSTLGPLLEMGQIYKYCYIICAKRFGLNVWCYVESIYYHNM